MKLINFKLFIYIIGFGILQGIAMPWVISNSILPVWIDLTLFAVILLVWAVIVDQIINLFVKVFRGKNGRIK